MTELWTGPVWASGKPPLVLTRGERNQNPLNINMMAPHEAWNGQVGIEIVPPGEKFTARFGRYQSAYLGIRAAAEQLIKDNTVHGLKTVNALVGDPIHGWAPAADRNDVAAYAKTVSAHVGILPSIPIDLRTPERLINIWPGFCIEENGRCLYAPQIITAACRDALGMPPAIQGATA